MEFRILGSLEAESGGRLVPLGWRFERRVLAALLLDAGRAVPVSRLVDAAWDEPPATAGKQVMNAVSRLRRALGSAGGGELIVTVAGGYRLAADRCTVDARVFEAGVAAAGRAASEGKTAEAAVLLRSALALWRGPALAGLAGRVLEQAAAAWDERRAAARETYYGLELALGRDREILGELADLAADYPLREKLAGLYMVALYRCGRQADALAAYRRTRELLAGQLGLDPGPELRWLQQQILTADPALALPGAAPVAVPRVRYSLPADMLVFTGRGVEVDRILAAAGGAAAASGIVAIHAIGGMPGVGKTTLAVHVAHALADRFPDRQLFIDLHAHTPGREPVQPQDALAGLLAAAGVDSRFLPADLDGRAGMWRDAMAGQKALLVLDNAASTSQVAPLLPGAGGYLVLVTSRRHLGDLPGAVTPVLLDVLTPEQAVEMFIRLAPRAAADLAGVAEVVELAGFLPLAVGLLARVLARHPSWTLADLAAETRDRLLILTAEHTSVAAAFEVSYRHLDPDAQRFFALLGLHPGPTTDAYAAAALAGTILAEAARMLDQLHGEGLLTETGHRRYSMHDLLRRYARDHAATFPAGTSERAVGRLLDYYQLTASRADAWLARQTRPGPPALPSAESFAAPDLDNADKALAWVRGERAGLLACLDYAASTGQDVRVIALTAVLAGLLRHDGPWADAMTRHTTALHAAQRLGDRLGQANALTDLGHARRLMDDYPAAARDLEQALNIYRELGNRLGQANTLNSLGDARRLMDDYPAAARNLEQALDTYRDLGNRLGQATAFHTLGDMRRATGDYLTAARDLEQALNIFRDLGHRLGQATALRGLGAVRRATGDYPAAAQDLEQALNIHRDLGDRLGQAHALRGLGAVRLATGEYLAATQDLEQALNIFRDLGHRLGQAHALNRLGDMRQATGEYPAAAKALEQALSIYRDLGNRLGQANALQRLGAVRQATGDYPAAARNLEQALSTYRDLGNPSGEAETLNETGTLHRVIGDLSLAQQCHQQALDLARATASSWDEAHALAGLGRCALTAGHTPQAETLFRQALEIFQRTGAAEATVLLAELDALGGHGAESMGR